MERMSRLLGEPERDPRLGDMLRRLETASEPGAAEELRRRIMAAARPRLGELRVPSPRWWELISGWTRLAVPVGLAASLAAGMLVRSSVTAAGIGSYATDLGSDSTLVLSAFSEPASGGQFAAQLMAPEGDDWLLEQAVTR
jgi:anti-sigma factor RsiW